MGLISSAVGAVGSIFGGLSASNAIKKLRKNIESQRQKNKDWYNRRYHEDGTRRADAQRMINRLEDIMRQRSQRASGVQAVMGGSEESVSGVKEANNKMLAETMSQILSDSEKRKDHIEATYMQNDNAYQDKLNELEYQKATGISGAVQGLANTAGDIADNYIDI